MKELKGKTITELYIAKDLYFLKFVVDDGEEIVYFTGGDCCSDSWFHHVLGVDALLNHEVVDVKEFGAIQIDNDEFTRQECDLLYKIMLMTGRGFVDIEFRNSSNGYYSGSCELWHGDPNYQTYFSGNVKEPIQWTRLTEDFTEGL